MYNEYMRVYHKQLIFINFNIYIFFLFKKGIQSDDTHNENKIDKQSLSSSYQTFSENESQNISEKNLSEFFFETKETSELVSKYKGIKLLKNLSSLITNKLSDIKSNDETNSEEDNKNDKGKLNLYIRHYQF